MISLATFDIGRLVAIAREAGAAIMSVYAGEFEVIQKPDASPLTLADIRSHEIICEQLTNWYPDVPVLSEESAEQFPYSVRKGWQECWLVDPLDGTKEFVRGSGDFTVNIALIQHARPIAGVVVAAARNVAYCAVAGHGAYKMSGAAAPTPISGRRRSPGDTLVVAASVSHPTPATEAFLEERRREYKSVELIAIGSSLKICMVADGSADMYPRFGPTMEWDTAAAHAIAAAAGRRVRNWRTGEELFYNKESLENDWFLVD